MNFCDFCLLLQSTLKLPALIEFYYVTLEFFLMVRCLTEINLKLFEKFNKFFDAFILNSNLQQNSAHFNIISHFFNFSSYCHSPEQENTNYLIKLFRNSLIISKISIEIYTRCIVI